MKTRISRCMLVLCATALLLTACSRQQSSLMSPSAPAMGRSSSSGYGFSDNYAVAEMMEDATVGKYTFSQQEPLAYAQTPPEHPQSGGYEDFEQKLVYNASISIETLEFANSVNLVSKLAEQYKGYIESSSIDGRTVYLDDETANLIDRYAYYTLRIPSVSFDAFLRSSGDLGNVTSESTGVQNITAQFYDTQSRLDAYQIQYDRMVALLEKADRMEDILSIERHLTEVRYQIEWMTTQMRSFQSQVSYSTINLYLREVTRYTPPARRSFGARLLVSILDSINGFSEWAQDFTIATIYALPYLMLALIVFVLLGRLRRKRGLPPMRIPRTLGRKKDGGANMTTTQLGSVEPSAPEDE